MEWKALEHLRRVALAAYVRNAAKDFAHCNPSHGLVYTFRFAHLSGTRQRRWGRMRFAHNVYDARPPFARLLRSGGVHEGKNFLGKATHGQALAVPILAAAIHGRHQQGAEGAGAFSQAENLFGDRLG